MLAEQHERETSWKRNAKTRRLLGVVSMHALRTVFYWKQSMLQLSREAAVHANGAIDAATVTHQSKRHSPHRSCPFVCEIP